VSSGFRGVAGRDVPQPGQGALGGADTLSADTLPPASFSRGARDGSLRLIETATKKTPGGLAVSESSAPEVVMLGINGVPMRQAREVNAVCADGREPNRAGRVSSPGHERASAQQGTTVIVREVTGFSFKGVAGRPQVGPL
jgi:hypothetical protein